MSGAYGHETLSRDEVDAMRGPVVLEFGTSWCGVCRATQPAIASAFASHRAVSHFRIEDGPGRRLGRSFGIKLWPTLVFMHDGVEVTRLVRPRDATTIADALGEIDPA
jgi:thioredoxin 1